MGMIDATQTFAALGHPGRLSVFRMLMRLAPKGARPTEIAQSLGMVQNTLSHHLAELRRCGLIRVERQLYHSVDLGRAEALVDYQVMDCCRGRPALCRGAVARSWGGVVGTAENLSRVKKRHVAGSGVNPCRLGWRATTIPLTHRRFAPIFLYRLPPRSHYI